ncbi:hypothetical protein A3Q41_04625 [Rhodococcoides fascians]|uniref:Uncharacterized protein n=1 Tax=Rhodococcoides fascians TaxID=1828 RepID=A0A143QSI4_RHOFA|nr:hypothetical protein A3Q41_04625 [Rhodococcus fascians]
MHMHMIDGLGGRCAIRLNHVEPVWLQRIARSARHAKNLRGQCACRTLGQPPDVGNVFIRD